MFKTQEEVLSHFMNDGDMVDVETGHVYMADCNGDGEFFGIMVGDPVPRELRDDARLASEYALEHYPAPGSGAPDRMAFMEAPGWWFGEFADAVIAEPGRFMATSCEE